MKKIILTVLAILVYNISFAQHLPIYAVTTYELIFSSAQYNVFDSKSGNVLRFSPWFNLEESVNFDIGTAVGFTAGMSVKNIGIIHKLSDPSTIDPKFESTTIKKKFRSYNIGIPVSFKLGNLSQFFIYGGYEFEIPINFREKTYINGAKTKYESEWFSNKTPRYMQSLFLGLKFPYNLGIKAKYYLTNFFANDCEDYVHDYPAIQYKDFEARVFYLSLTIDLFNKMDTRITIPTPSNRNKRNSEPQYYYD